MLISACDWSKVYTPESAEKDLHRFKFKGVGWYNTRFDTMLVRPTSIEGAYMFHTWNSPNLRDRLMSEMAGEIKNLLDLPVYQ